MDTPTRGLLPVSYNAIWVANIILSQETLYHRLLSHDSFDILNPNSRNREVYFELVLYAWTFSWKWSKSKKLFKSKYPLITKYISHKHNGVGAPKLLKCWWKSIYLTNKTNKTFFLHIFFYFFILAAPGGTYPPPAPLSHVIAYWGGGWTAH